MFGQIGGQQGIGGPLSPDSIGGESFIRHIEDKLIYDFKSGSGTTVKDRSREGNDGTFGAGAAAPTWKRNSLYLDGGDYVDLTGISHGITTSGFSFCFGIDRACFGKELFSQGTAAVFFLFDPLDIRSYLGVSWKTLSDSISVAPVIIQIIRDNSGNLESYANMKIGDKGQTDTSDATYDGSSAIKLCNGFIGTMYSFRILNKCLSGIECQQIYLSTKFRGNN